MQNPFLNPESKVEPTVSKEIPKKQSDLSDNNPSNYIEGQNKDGVSDNTKNEPGGLEDNKDSVRKIKTINDALSGQKHPETEVPYMEKEVVTDTGEKVVGVFPQFESVFDAKLPEDMQMATDREQFAECNKQLKEYCDKHPDRKSFFNERQLEDINEGRTPYGYTWHHNEEVGKMQLVDYDVHEQTRHTGGRSIWGGGTENRR